MVASKVTHRYILRPISLHSGCLHWQVSSGVFFASAQVSLQWFFPGAAVQLQAVCSHFFAVVMKAPFKFTYLHPSEGSVVRRIYSSI